MKKVLFIFVLCVCLSSCNTIKLECSNEEPVYRVEDKKHYNGNYYIRVSKLYNPDSLDTKQFGYYTWKELDKGDKLDKNYRFVK